MSGSVQEAMAAGAARLAAAGVVAPARDARRLMAGALEVAPDRLLLVAGDLLAPDARTRFERFIAARARFQPVAQILGRRKFWGREFEVSPAVLDPRPETETLVACALQGPEPRRLLDLGTGSGAILVSLLAEWPEACGLGTDRSPEALALAARNAALHGVGARARFRLGDWTRGITERFDLVVCNPPYIPAAEVAQLSADVRDWEPPGALTPGPLGIESYRAIAPTLGDVLAPGGRAFFEFGAGQGPAVVETFAQVGFAEMTVFPDLDGRDRVLALRQAA